MHIRESYGRGTLRRCFGYLAHLYDTNLLDLRAEFSSHNNDLAPDKQLLPKVCHFRLQRYTPSLDEQAQLFENIGSGDALCSKDVVCKRKPSGFNLALF